MNRVFVDGQHGTAGLRLAALIREHPGLTLLEIGPNERRDIQARRSRMQAADVVAFCLPADAVGEAVSLVPPGTKVIDASRHHRASAGWVYGLPELSKAQRQDIASAQRVANPGCFATAFLLAVRPLVDGGLIDRQRCLHSVAMTGYSAGGAPMIARYEDHQDVPRWYTLELGHPHLPEMRRYAGLGRAPIFLPSVGGHRHGMHLTVSLEGVDREQCLSIFRQSYHAELFVHIRGTPPRRLSPVWSAPTNDAFLYVSGQGHDTLLSVRLHNLMKGAAGAMVQNINLMLGLPEASGLQSAVAAGEVDPRHAESADGMQTVTE